jgi:peptidyl-prolyl cis-trans isomerase SurA
MKLHTPSFLFAAALGLSLAAAPLRAEVVDRVAAVVNDELITWTEVYDLGRDHIERGAAASPDARRGLELEVLDVLIGRSLVEQEMRKLGIEVGEQEIERALSDIARQNGLDREQLRREVEGSGLLWDSYLGELEQNLREMMFNQQVLAPRITIRDDELLDAYRRNLASLSGPEQAHLQTLLLAYPADASDEQKAEILQQALALRQQAQEGAVFADLAAEHSAEPYASRRGEMGTFREGELVGTLDRPAFATPEGEVAEPIITPQGVFLLHVVSRGQPDAPPFEEVKPRLQQQLMELKYDEAREQWEIQARRRAAVKVLLESK